MKYPCLSDMNMGVVTWTLKFGVNLQNKLEKLACTTPKYVSIIYNFWCPKRVWVTWIGCMKKIVNFVYFLEKFHISQFSAGSTWPISCILVNVERDQLKDFCKSYVSYPLHTNVSFSWKQKDVSKRNSFNFSGYAAGKWWHS